MNAPDRPISDKASQTSEISGAIVFNRFFHTLRDYGIPVSPTAFLKLHQALGMGLVQTLNDFYIASRTTLIKSERFFDLFDQLFAHYFKGAILPDDQGVELDDLVRELLTEWLKDPLTFALEMGIDPETFKTMTPEELIQYFLDRLKEQDRRHDGGDKWIGTGGIAPAGNFGFHPGGMRVSGMMRNKSAVKVALGRRYRDYSLEGPLTQSMVGEALKRLRNMLPVGPEDQVDVDATIYRTMRNGGEIEIIFEKALRDKLRVILAIDNGGWSMDPYIPVVQTLFDYARNQFKDIKTYFFHNTIYDVVWKDAARRKFPVKVSELAAKDEETRLIVIGDASMAPYELNSTDGAISIDERSGKPSREQLKMLAESFPHAVWLNPVPKGEWGFTRTIQMIREIFPMFELTIDGLEKAVAQLMAK